MQNYPALIFGGAQPGVMIPKFEHTNKQTNTLTNKQTPLKTPNAVRYATTLGNKPDLLLFVWHRCICTIASRMMIILAFIICNIITAIVNMQSQSCKIAYTLHQNRVIHYYVTLFQHFYPFPSMSHRVTPSWPLHNYVTPVHSHPEEECMYVCMYKNLCSRSSLQPRLSRRRYDQL